MSVVASTSSNFSVVGLIGVAPLSFNWAYSGTRTWNVDNASFNVTLNAGLSGAGFIDNVGWGIRYVDPPASQQLSPP